MWIDITGFTSLAERLNQKYSAAEGEEILTNVLNEYFTAINSIIESHHGCIFKIAGGESLSTLNFSSLPQTPSLLYGTTPHAVSTPCLMPIFSQLSTAPVPYRRDSTTTALCALNTSSCHVEYLSVSAWVTFYWSVGSLTSTKLSYTVIHYAKRQKGPRSEYQERSSCRPRASNSSR